jgi:hypothetical protein
METTQASQDSRAEKTYPMDMKPPSPSPRVEDSVPGGPHQAEAEQRTEEPINKPASTESRPSPDSTSCHQERPRPSVTPPEKTIPEAKTSQEQPAGGAKTSGTEEIPRQPLKLSDHEAPDSDFIKDGHWWGKHVTAAVDTQQEKAEVVALQSDLDSVFARVNVSFLSIFCLLTCIANKSSFAENYQLFKGQGHDTQSFIVLAG